MDSSHQSEPTPEFPAAPPAPELQDAGWAVYAEVPYQDPDATPVHGTPVTPKPKRQKKQKKPAAPFAVAVGNASLLGVGYFLLRRWLLGVLSALGTVVLLVLHLNNWPTLGFEFVVLGWWVLLVTHGYLLARPHPRARPARRQWIVALAAALPTVVAFTFLRLDAASVDEDVATARANGDCAAALAAAGRLWAGNRLADAPLAEHSDATVAACDRLRAAGGELDAALSGETDRLTEGFDGLRGVLGEFPGHEEMVTSVVNRFLDGLPTEDPCRTTGITDWLKAAPQSGVLRPATEVVPGIAPAAIVACADGLMAKSNWNHGRRYYQKLVDEYPDHELVPTAKQGIAKATRELQLANVRNLLSSPGTGEWPAYCDSPAPFNGAKPYRPGKPNRSLLYGNTIQTNKIPKSWRAKGVTDAVVIICADVSHHGTPVRTCPYVPDSRPGYVSNVTFHKIAIPLKLYELRTGKLVRELTLQINGTSCPRYVHYSTYGIDTGPPPQMYVSAPVDTVRAAFRPLMVG